MDRLVRDEAGGNWVAGGREPDPPAPFPIVGIGASAGGLEAMSQLLSHLPEHPGMAFVLVQHLDPRHESSLAELLSRVSAMPVHEATHETAVEVDQVYVIPPNTALSVKLGVLHLSPRSATRSPQRLIDHFLCSLAEGSRGTCLGVILSGTGSDGTLGLEAVKAEGGITFAQDATAAYDGMPHSAIAAGCVDFVLSPEDIARELLRIGRHFAVRCAPDPTPDPLASGNEGDSLAVLFGLLRGASGVDFAHYKQSTVRRRIHRRMVVNEKERIDDYVRLLQEDPREVEALYQDILIHVTSFFRDPDSFEALTRLVFPGLLKGRPADAPIRVWVPGCSTGEEVYSLAICLLEYLDSRAAAVPIKLFGTDVAEAVVTRARSGRYSASIEADVSPERLRRFFLEGEGGYQIGKEVRDCCVFARQDATRDPPFSNLDLISCRNTLIYLGPVLQKRVLPTLHYALKEDGYLLLGKSETVGPSSDLFSALDARHRLYVRRSVPSRLALDRPGEREAAAPGHAAGAGAPGSRPTTRPVTALDVQREADRLVLKRFSPAGVVLDDALEVIQFRGDTGPYLAPAAGAPTVHILKLARDGLLPGLRAAIEEARERDAKARREGVWIKAGRDSRAVNLEVIPIRVPLSTQRSFLVLFEDATAPPEPPGEPARSSEDVQPPDNITTGSERLAELERELGATKERLHEIIEQQEVANEELRAANEESLSTNEELQSTNEELQTAKEELQATNEEMQATNEELITINEELELRNLEALHLNNDLTNLLTSASIPIVMLGSDLRIRRLTPNAGKALNLLPADVGRPITQIRLPIGVPDLETLLLEVMAEASVKVREVRDQQGRWHSLSLRPYQRLDGKVDGAVITLVDVDAIKRSEQRVREARDYADNIVQTVREPLVVLDGELRVTTANRSFHQMFRTSPAEMENRRLWELGGGRWDVATLREMLVEIQVTGEPFDNAEIQLEIPAVGLRTLLLNARRVRGGDERLILLAIADVTDRRRDEAARVALERKLQDTQKRESLGILAGGIAHDFNNILTAILGSADLVEHRLPPGSPLLPYLKSIEDGAQRAAELCDQMLAYSGKGRFQVRRLDLSALVRDTHSLLQLSIGKNATLRLDLAADLPAVQADATQIRQVLMNLVINAAEAIGDRSGAITAATGLIRAGPAELAQSLITPDIAETDYVYLEVRDDGCGMSAETRSRIFDPFFTTKFTGRGLGLAAVLGIVRGHRGALTVESEPQRGSTFRLLLPRAEHAAEDPAAAMPAALPWRGKGTVLVVDDEEGVRSVIAAMLEMLGFRVVLAGDGREGLATFSASAEPIGLVLLDLTMPHQNGEETFQALRQLRPDVRVILMSGYNAQDVVNRVTGQGLAGFLRKPFRLEDLAARLRSALEG